MLWIINYLNCGFEQPGKSFTNINAAYLTLNTATMNECCNILFASLLLMLYVPADLHVFIVVFCIQQGPFFSRWNTIILQTWNKLRFICLNVGWNH